MPAITRAERNAIPRRQLPRKPGHINRKPRQIGDLTLQQRWQPFGQASPIGDQLLPQGRFFHSARPVSLVVSVPPSLPPRSKKKVNAALPN